MFLYQKLKYDYKHIDITDKQKAVDELKEFLMTAHKEKPEFICYDTETDGLNIIKSKPFLMSIGFNKHIRTFDYDSEIVNALWKMYMLPNKESLKNIQGYDNFIGLFAHNAKYDYHMVDNGGSTIPDDIRIFDSITIARLTEYVDEKASMSLETLGGKYVDDTSKFAGKVIKDLIKKINLERRKKLREDIMNQFPNDGFSVVTKSGKLKSTGKLTKLIEEYDKTRTHFVNDDNE